MATKRTKKQPRPPQTFVSNLITPHSECKQKHDAGWTEHCFTCLALFRGDEWRAMAQLLWNTHICAEGDGCPACECYKEISKEG